MHSSNYQLLMNYWKMLYCMDIVYLIKLLVVIISKNSKINYFQPILYEKQITHNLIQHFTWYTQKVHLLWKNLNLNWPYWSIFIQLIGMFQSLRVKSSIFISVQLIKSNKSNFWSKIMKEKSTSNLQGKTPRKITRINTGNET